MAKIIIDGFEFFDWGLNQRLLFISDKNIEKALIYIKDKHIKELIISDDIKDLLFLENVNFIEDLHISDNFTDYSGIYYIENLKKLSVNNFKFNSKIQIQKFKSLEYLSIDWNNDQLDLSFNFKLRELIIWKYKPSSKSFHDITFPVSLESFQITETNIENLKDLKNTNINQLQAYYCPKLISLYGLAEIKESLKIIIIENAKNIRDFDDLWECENLEKIILTNCGLIPSLKKLSKLKKVKMLTFYNTTVEDGVLDNLFNVDYVYFKNQKHYNHKLKDFENKK